MQSIPTSDITTGKRKLLFPFAIYGMQFYVIASKDNRSYEIIKADCSEEHGLQFWLIDGELEKGVRALINAHLDPDR